MEEITRFCVVRTVQFPRDIRQLLSLVTSERAGVAGAVGVASTVACA